MYRSKGEASAQFTPPLYCLKKGARYKALHQAVWGMTIKAPANVHGPPSLPRGPKRSPLSANERVAEGGEP